MICQRTGYCCINMFVVVGMFGLFMDLPQNRMGATGWDMAQGNL